MAAKSQDKVIFGAALFLLLASAGWMVLQGSKPSALRVSAEAEHLNSSYVPSGIDAPHVSTSTWSPPPSQSSGPEWVYDLFTPPEIYYDTNTKKFSVTPPVAIVVDNTIKAPPFGAELIQIKPDVFRLQLVGYIGGEGDYRGTFENTVTGDTVIGRAGKTFPDLGLTIKSFTVKRNKIESKESMATYETEATAVVVDTKTGDEVTLSNKQRRVKGEPFAVLKVDGLNEPVQRRAGETFQAGSATYTVVTVTLEPPSAEVRKESPDLKQPETKTLTPFTPAPPAPAAPAPEQPAAATPFPLGT